MRTGLGIATRGRPAGTRRAVLAVVTVGLLLAATSCGDDSSDDEGDDGPSDTPPSTTTTTHPSTEDDEEAAFDIVKDLETEVDALVERLYRDPSVVDDPDNPDLQRLEEIVAEEHLESVRTALRENNEEGVAQVAPSSGVYLETYVYDIGTVDGDTIRYAFCAVQDLIRVDAEGNELDEGFATGVQGIRQAHRENGLWRLVGTEDSNTEEIEPGSTSPGYCESRIIGDPEGGES
jgi:hypothetical protein